jgi:hypothetical protein
MKSESDAEPVSEVTDEDVALILGSSAEDRLVPPVDQRSDEELVHLSRLQRLTSHQYGGFGFQAASELIRRLTDELRHSREQAKESASKLERYTVQLVRLTVVIAILTLVLVGHTVIQSWRALDGSGTLRARHNAMKPPRVCRCRALPPITMLFTRWTVQRR